MPAEPDQDAARVQRFADAMNRQGYAFQNKVLSVAKELNQNRRSRWVFEAAEFPVEAGEQGTRIDFVLWVHQTTYWMLAECKRVNPAYADWFFLRTPFVRRNHHERYVAELATVGDSGFTSGGVTIAHPPEQSIFHMGFEVKTNKPGDPSGGSNRSPIEDAATQACRGMNGLVNLFHRDPRIMGPTKWKLLLPVIFTTAKLYAGEADLSDIDLETGELDASKLTVAEKPFIYYQYHLSPGLKHGAPRPQELAQRYDGGLSPILQAEFIRTIPIVTATGIEEFFSQFDPGGFSIDRLAL